MKNFKLTIEYDGSGFSGWQVQPDRRTVQGELYGALGRIAGVEDSAASPPGEAAGRSWRAGGIKITGAGRTDAGVHAAGQVASASLETDHGAGTILRALGGILPPDILVREVEEVGLSFNARFDACSRRYDYIFIARRTALWRDYFHSVPENVDVGAMRAQLRMLRGENDFAPFASSGSGAGSTVCRVIDADLIESRPLLILSITADRFLYNMVRSIAGTVLRAGRGKQVRIGDILASGDRSAAGPTLPPGALYLMEVRY